MEGFQIKYFSERLKEIARKDFGGNNGLAEAISVSPQIISNYTQKDAREPKASFLAKLSSVGVDLNYLLTGERGKLLNGEILERIKKLEENNIRLEREVDELKEYKELSLKLLIENRSLADEVEQLRVQSEKDIALHVPERLAKKD